MNDLFLDFAINILGPLLIVGNWNHRKQKGW
jgi:hypothetical protein